MGFFRKGFSSSSVGGSFEGGFGVWFFSVDNGSPSKWQIIGIVSLLFAFSQRNGHSRLIDVHHRNSSGLSEAISWRTSSLPQTFRVTDNWHVAECLHFPHTEKK